MVNAAKRKGSIEPRRALAAETMRSKRKKLFIAIIETLAHNATVHSSKCIAKETTSSCSTKLSPEDCLDKVYPLQRARSRTWRVSTLMHEDWRR